MAAQIDNVRTGPAIGQATWMWGTVAAFALWCVLYSQLESLLHSIVAQLPRARGGAFESTLQFFIYDTPKVLLLLTLVTFAMGVIRSFFLHLRRRARCWLVAARASATSRLRGSGS